MPGKPNLAVYIGQQSWDQGSDQGMAHGLKHYFHYSLYEWHFVRGIEGTDCTTVDAIVISSGDPPTMTEYRVMLAILAP